MRSNGYRRRTRNLFSKGHKKHGNPTITKTLQQFKVGDLVDIKVDPSVVKGMPHKYYHGQTGRVYDVNNRAVSIIVYRKVGHKYIERHINARVEHLSHSRCNEDTKKRFNEHRIALEQARAAGKTVKPVKRQPVGPREAVSVTLKNNTPVEVSFKKYHPVY